MQSSHINSVCKTKLPLKCFQLEKQFLLYLEQEDILKELEVTVLKYEKNIYELERKPRFLPPFRFLLKLDLMKIQEISEHLNYIIIKEPEASMDLIKNVIYCIIHLIISIKYITKQDMQVTLFVLNLPITSEIQDLLCYPSYAMESIQGVLISKTTISKYMRSSVRRCGLFSCPGNKWQRYQEGFGTMCSHCYSLMDEDLSFTDTGEEIVCQILSLKAYKSQGRFQSLTVKVRDELCGLVDLQVGEEYKIIGRLNGTYFQAYNMQSKQSEFCNFLPHLFSFALPESIANLYFRVSEISPWSFVLSLSSQLGSHLLPSSSFLHLKTGLMLSLSTQKNDVPVPLIAIGNDSLYTQLLFHISGQYAQKYVRYSVSNSNIGGTARAGQQADVILQESGQLILAANGVCNLGEWSKFKKEQADYICQAIESGQILFNRGELGKKNLINFVPLKCAIWTYWCHVTTKLNHQLQLKTLINVFGIPFLAQEKNEFEINKICWRNLTTSMKNTETISNFDVIPKTELMEFLEIINSRKLHLSNTASELIRNYFVASRRERPQCLPLSAIKIITSLAEAHARIALRNEVLYEDVVVIIYFYEEAIATLFGKSKKPYPKLTWNYEEPIYVFMGKQIEQFSVWLNEYISVLINDS